MVPKRLIILSIFAALAAAHTEPSSAQWESVGTFPHLIANVHFLSDVGHPEIGFVGMCRADKQFFFSDSERDPADVWRTSDGGMTWQAISLTVSVGDDFCTGWDLTFKDSLNGWMTGHDYFHTTDGGITWNHMSQVAEGTETGIYYHPITKLLFLSTFYMRQSFSSGDGGLTWTRFSGDQAGYAFTGLNGIVAGCDGAGNYTLYTADGGVSWSQSAFKDECWQPVGIPGTTTFFAASEHENRVSRSDDGGKTWRTIFSYAPPRTPFNFKGLSGCIRADKCGNLYMQSDTEGILMSADEGISWHSIGGPSAGMDVRIWITDDYLYAGEGPTGGNPAELTEQGALWRYRISDPPAPPVIVKALSSKLRAGDTVGVSYTMPSDSVFGFDTVHFAIHFDDALDLRSIVLPPGWSVLDSSSKNGVLDLWMISDSAPLRSQLLALNFGTALENSFAKVYLDSAHFYYTHPAICGDNALALAGPDSVELDFTGCGDSTLLRYMADSLAFRIVSVQPNPASGALDITLSRATGTAVAYELYDALGTTRLRGVTQGGDIALDVSSLPEGIYFFRASTEGATPVSRKIAIAR